MKTTHSQTRRAATILAVIGITASLSACAPWYTKYGIEKGANLQSPENTAKLVEIVRTENGFNAYRAAELLTSAEPTVTAPVMPEIFEILSTYCTLETDFMPNVPQPKQDENGDLIPTQPDISRANAAAPTSTNSKTQVSNHGCPALALAAKRHGANAAPELARLNPYASVVTLGALGPDGRDGVHALFAAISSPHAIIRQEAANSLLKVAYPSSDVLAILDATRQEDPDPGVREAAGRAHRNLTAMALAAPLPEPTPKQPAPTTPAGSDKNKAGKPAPDDFAIIIGIEKYRDALPPSTAAIADAKMFASIAETTLGIPRRNIILLTDDSATKSSLDSYLEDWLPKNIKSSSRVYFFFAGHGAPDPQTGKGYLVPWDGDPRFIERQGIGVDDVAQTLQNIGAKQVVMMVDACFSGSGGRSVLAAGTRPLVPVKEFDPVQTETKFAMFAAAGANETTGTTPDQTHGLFSHYLFEAFRGQADANNDNTLTLNEIIHFVGNHVPDEARRENRQQTPRYQFSADTVGELEIVHFP